MGIQNLKPRWTVGLVRQERQNHQGNDGKFYRGDNVFGRNPAGKLVELPFQRQEPHDDNHQNAGFQQPVVPAQRSQEIHHDEGKTGGQAVFFLVHETVGHVACHQKEAHHHKARDERSHGTHEFRKERCQSATETYDREGTDACGVAACAFGVGFLPLHADDKADAQCRGQLVEFVEFNHRAPPLKISPAPTPGMPSENHFFRRQGTPLR